MTGTEEATEVPKEDEGAESEDIGDESSGEEDIDGEEEVEGEEGEDAMDVDGKDTATNGAEEHTAQEEVAAN